MKRIAAWLPMLVLCAALPFASLSADPPPPEKPDTSVHPEDEAKSFTGTWYWQEGDQQLIVSLEQKDDKLTGYHAFRNLSTGHSSSVSYPEPPSIVGDVHSSIVTARLKSGDNGSYAYGHVRLTLRDRYLYWQIMDTNGSQILPQNIVLLRRASSSPAH